MRTYVIQRSKVLKKVICEVRNGDHTDYPLVHIGTHGEGFEYGYHGSSPADLAWSILANVLGESNMTDQEQRTGDFLSAKLHQRFKEQFIAPLNPEMPRHILFEEGILAWLEQMGLDVNEYTTRRELYRNNKRAMDRLEEEYASRELTTSVQSYWSELNRMTIEYQEWLHALTVRE